MQLQLPPFAFGSAVALGIVCPRQQPNSAALLAQQCQPAGMDAIWYGIWYEYKVYGVVCRVKQNTRITSRRGYGVCECFLARGIMFAQSNDKALVIGGVKGLMG